MSTSPLHSKEFTRNFFSVTLMPVSSSWFTMADEIKPLWASSRKTELRDYSNSNIFHDSHRIYECHRVSENIHLWPQVAAREADMFGN